MVHALHGFNVEFDRSPNSALFCLHTKTSTAASSSRRITEECYEQAIATLTEHRGQLNALAQALLEHETLDEADAYAAAGLPRPSATAAPQPEQTEGAPAIVRG